MSTTDEQKHSEKTPGIVDGVKRVESNEDLKHGRSDLPTDDNVVDSTFQAGVQDIEAVTISWTKTSLIIAIIFIWLIYFVQGLVAGISNALIPYITSSFAMHSLTPTTSVLSAVIGGVTNMSIAKVLDVFGRPQGFLFCAILATLGLIMAAAWWVQLHSSYFSAMRIGLSHAFQYSLTRSFMQQQCRGLCRVTSLLHSRKQWHRV